MCNYRYIYYSSCRHPEFTLVNFCDKAYERAVLGAPQPRDAAEGVEPRLEHNTTATALDSTTYKPSGQTAGHGKHGACASVVEQRAEGPEVSLQPPAQQAEAKQQTPPPPTWASVARIAAEANSGSVPQATPACVMASNALSSPAQRLAARLDSAKTAGDSNASSMHSSDPFQPAPGNRGNEDSSRGRWVGRGSYRGGGGGRRGSTLSTVTEHGSGGWDQTVRAARPLQEHVRSPTPEGTSIDIRSPAEFPLLSPVSAPLSSTLPARARSSSASSWAHVARLVSVDRPDSSSTTEPTAESDAGTVSTSPSSFASDILDPTLLVVPSIPAMAPPRASGATLDFRRPHSSTNAAHQSGSPRRRLPAEWTGGLQLGSEKTTPAVTKRKSLGNLGRQFKAAHEGSTVTPKSPTKVVPFVLATARRAAAREQKDKTSGTAKLVPAVPKAVPPDKAGSKTYSKASSSDSTSTSQCQTAAASPFPSGSSQSFATAREEPYHPLPQPGSPSRIPRLVVALGRSGAPRTSGSEPSPVRPKPLHEASVSETASEPPADIQRTPSPAAPPLQNIVTKDPSLSTASSEDEVKTLATSERKEGGVAAIDIARSEMSRSNEAIAEASTAVADIRHAEHPRSHVHFAEAREASQNKIGLSIAHNPLGLSFETSEHPTVPSPDGLQGFGYIQHSSQATSPIASSATHAEAISHYAENSNIEREASEKKSTLDDTEQNDARSPETINTWPETSDISASQETEFESMSPGSKASRTPEEGSYGPVLESLFEAELEADSEFSFDEDQSSSSKPFEDSQWPLHSLDSGNNSNVRASKEGALASSGNSIGTTTSTCISVPPHRRAAFASRPFNGNAMTPSRLNAQAQEFVPGGIQFGNQVLVTASRGTHARPQMPPEWMVTQSTDYTPGKMLPNQSSTTEPTASCTGRKGKKKKKGPRRFSEEHSNSRDRPSDTDASVYNPHPSWSVSWSSSSAGGPYSTVPGYFGTTGVEYGTPVGPSGGSWSISNVSRDLGYGGALRTITNASYGHRPKTPNQAPRAPYLGRGGSGMPAGSIPKGNEQVEKLRDEGWTSTNGGPLTHGAVYEHLRSADKACEKHPSIFPPFSEDGAREKSGYGTLRPCGNVNMVGAFEALPHYPLLCPKCQPDSHESMQA
ncbi:proteophosphoglycan ppg1 [Diplodia corticola]|uniref:Proteophosphoglycan ppg1 n=1 Tax=Diplodia corticola TaxID=236234 RepID=A0A1J9RGW5_9PEZI|nr:proteophosphoglycan ppg1 [Diplodia corticola]OJD40798.1 proteophosphoglycan ppg1 [Diplodia corticola]